MRALIRSVTGSPASAKGKAKPGKGRHEQQHYSIGDIASSWSNIKSILAAGALSANNHASSSSSKVPANEHSSKEALASISRSLDVIVDGLVIEQSTLSSDDAGPCLEYVLTNNVFSSIAQAAVDDQPAGVLGLVIRTFDSLVILLGEAFVTFGHRPLNHLLHECIIHEEADLKPAVTGQIPSNAQLKIKLVAEPYEEELASLACSICSRIKTQPDLLPLFFHDKRLSHRTRKKQPGNFSTTIHVKNHGSPLSSPPATFLSSPRPPLSQCSSQASISSATSVSEFSESSPSSSAPPTVESKQYTFLVFDFLIRLLHRHGRIGELARLGLLFTIDLAMSNSKAKATSTSAAPAFPVFISGKSNIDNATAATPELIRRGSKKPKRKAVIGQSDRLSLLSYIEDSDFADVLAAGLGASLAVLPSHLYVPIPSLSAPPAVEIDIAAPRSPELEAHDSISLAMREHGIALLSEPEIKDSLALFIAIINFAMDVTRKAPKTALQHNTVPQDASNSSITSSVTIKMQSLIGSIRASFGTVFLQNALLPRVIDAASPTAEDAAVIAVLVYIDTLISTLETETPLFEETLSALLARQSTDSTVPSDKSAMLDYIRRILMYSLTSHVGNSPSAPHHTGPLSKSLSASIQLSALRLLHTLLNKADWSALELFSIHPSLGCTIFPFRIPQEEGDEDAFVYPDDGDSDRDSFIYPNEEDHRQSIAAFAATSSARARSKKVSKEEPRFDLLLGLLMTDTPSTKSPFSPTDHGHRRSISRHSSRSSLDAFRQSETSPHKGMSFQKYLKQAETSIQHDQSFIRGLAIISATHHASPIPSHNTPKLLSTMSPTIQVADLSMDSGTSSLQSDTTSSTLGSHAIPVEDRMLQHRVMLHLGLMAQLHALLSTFFINEPAVNLALTKILAKLAICPYRDLHGWLVPEGAGNTLAILQHLNLLEKLGMSSLQGTGASSTPKSRQSTENTKVTDWLRQNSYASQAVQEYEDAGLDPAGNPSILSRYSNLLKEVQDSHHSQIKDFDRLLQERRQSMLFVEDLAEAMQGGSVTSGSPLEASSSSWHIPFTRAGIPSPVRTSRQRVDSSATEREYLNSLSPYAIHLRETSSRLVMIRLEQPAEDEIHEAGHIETATAEVGAPLSRFWSASSSQSDHPEERSALGTHGRMGEYSSGLSPIPERLKVNTNLMLLSDLKTPIGVSGAESQAIYHEVPVNLSKYLDNLVILEESLKELVAIITVRLRIGIDPMG